MRFFILFFIVLTIHTGCRNHRSVPSAVLPPEQMQVVLWDMMRADQFLNDFVFSKDTGISKPAESIKMYLNIFRIHQITKEQFDKSFEWYRNRPGRMKEILDSMAVEKATQETRVRKVADDQN